MSLTIGDWIQLSVAVGTIAMAIATFITISISQKQHKQTLKEMQEQRKPILKICDDSDEITGRLCIKNIGLGPSEFIVLIAKNNRETIMFSISVLGINEKECLASTRHDVFAHIKWEEFKISLKGLTIPEHCWSVKLKQNEKLGREFPYTYEVIEIPRDCF
jgi:hypothetical protein